MTGEKVHAGRAGRVVEVNFQVGSKVKQGDVLIRLDTERIGNDVKIRQRTIAAGQADLAELDRQDRFLAQKYEVDKTRADRELEQAREEVRRAQERQAAEVVLARAELENAEHEEAQLRRLVPRAAPQSELIRAAAQAAVARANLQKARVSVDDAKVRVLSAALAQLAREYDLKRSELGLKRQAKQRELDTAKVELANLELELRETVIYAHTDGVVTAGEVRVGDVLDAGTAALAIAQEQGFRVDVAVPSAEIGLIREEMQVRVKLDAFDFQRYGTVRGTVYHIAPDSQRPEGQQALIFLVKVALEGDQVGRGEYRGQVKLGMTGQAEVVTGRDSILSLLLKKVRQTISLG